MSESLVPSEHQPLTLAKPSGVPAVLTGTTFLAFLWSVRSHWVTLMGGGAITVGLGLIERFSGKNVPRWIYGGVIVGFVFWAAYLTWRDTKQRLIQREVKLKNALEPKLRISFEERSPFIDPYETDAHLAVLFRVKVFSSIFGVVRVKVEEVEMEGRGFADIYLRPTNKDQGQNQTEMHPNSSWYWDVLEKRHLYSGLLLVPADPHYEKRLGSAVTFRIIATNENAAVGDSKIVRAKITKDSVKFELDDDPEYYAGLKLIDHESG